MGVQVEVVHGLPVDQVEAGVRRVELAQRDDQPLGVVRHRDRAGLGRLHERADERAQRHLLLEQVGGLTDAEPLGRRVHEGERGLAVVAAQREP